MTFDLAAMRADAAAGTPGPWDVDEDWNVFAGDHENGTRVDVAEPMNAAKSLPDSSRIARIPAMEAEIERLLAENARMAADRNEAYRRRDEWKAKAAHYPELQAAVREKAKEAGPSISRLLLIAALAESEDQVARLQSLIGNLDKAIIRGYIEAEEASHD